VFAVGFGAQVRSAVDWFHQQLDQCMRTPTAEDELESLAVLFVAENDNSKSERLRARLAMLIESGFTADDLTVRAIAQSLRDPERKALASTVADVIAGVSPATALSRP
jgi:hypothetical protein